MKGIALIVWFALAGVASIALFNITFEVEQLQDELNDLNKQILDEQKAVHVLRAEWSFLSRPERIERLSQRLLPGLRPPTVEQVRNLDGLNVEPGEQADGTAQISAAAVRRSR